jgi:hypothetical protein
MSLEKKLLGKYFTNEEVEQILEERMSPLRKYITSIGMNWASLSPEQISKISRSEAYRQFRVLNTVKYKYKHGSPALNSLTYKEDIEEDAPIHEPREYEPSKKYKHLDTRHIARQQYFAGLINKGYSALKTAPLFKSVGPKGFLARKPDVITFKKHKISPTGKLTTASSITKRELHKKKEYTGKQASYEDVNIFEAESIKKKAIPKMNNMKEIKPEENKQCEKEFEITKTLTGENKETNTIQINPNMKIIKKSEKDKPQQDKKEVPTKKEKTND